MPYTLRAVRPRWIVLSLIAGGLAAGCNPNGEDQPGEGDLRRSSQFGDPYQIVGNFADADPDITPILEGDTLFARLTYPGGCESHDFDLEYEVERDTAKLWLYHDAHGDDCEGMLRDELRVRVPDEVLDAPTIVMLHPEGGTPEVLKWGR